MRPKSKFTSAIKKMLNIVPIPALSDNYMYLVIDETTKECAVVDPVEPEKVIENVEKNNLELTTVLTTHHHWDHAGGNEKLLQIRKNLKVYGGDDRISQLTHRIGALEGRCIFTPCHTSGHICYFIDDKTKKYVFTVHGMATVTAAVSNRISVRLTCNQSYLTSVFHIAIRLVMAAVLRLDTLLRAPEFNKLLCGSFLREEKIKILGLCPIQGDTLFVGGCGRFFEGTAHQMYDALFTKLGALPDDTLIFCGHEYTVQNLTYAKHAEPMNKQITAKLEWAKKLRANGQFTIPSTMSEEKSYNPFLRVQYMFSVEHKTTLHLELLAIFFDKGTHPQIRITLQAHRFTNVVNC
uniref:hydroxyacylglutathione hydrolase n=1 Tax=Romanomermis culicivorax TaxID=13658 RepID=A0A915J3K3_ROMCU